MRRDSTDPALSRRALLQMLGASTVGLAVGARAPAGAQVSGQTSSALPGFTGPGPNVYDGSVGPLVTYPQKLPLIRLTDRPVQLETPRHYFRNAITPNEAFYVRWHLDGLPTEVDLGAWRLSVEGAVARPLTMSLRDLLRRPDVTHVAAVNQCSGNSRSRFDPRVPGGQWGNGAMGNAVWTGVPLRGLLAEAAPGAEARQIQFEGLERGDGPEGLGSREFLKSFDLGDPALDRAVVAFAMNGEPIPMLNGFPVRLVVPGKFATYWVKALTWIRVLDRPDENFWMSKAYRIPDTPDGNTTPEAVAAGSVKMVPIGTVDMPVRSFIVDPDGSSKVPAGMPLVVRGIAFSGHGRVVKVEFSDDDGKSWRDTRMGEDLGSYSFRTWETIWTPVEPGNFSLAARATDEAGNTQPDKGVWNPGGYLWNRIERQAVVVGEAG